MPSTRVPVADTLTFDWRPAIAGYRVGVVTEHRPTRDIDTPYLVDELEPFRGTRAWVVVKPAAPPGQEPYKVERRPDGSWHCTCPGSSCRHQDCDCRHKLLCQDGIKTGEL